MATEENQKPEPAMVVDALGDANESASAHHEPDEEPQPAAAQPDVEEPAPEKALLLVFFRWYFCRGVSGCPLCCGLGWKIPSVMR